MNINNIKKFLVGSVVPLSVFQDTFLQDSIFSISLGSPAVIAITILVFIKIFEIKNFYKLTLNRYYLFILLVYLSLNIYYLIYFSSEYSTYALSIKALKILILYFYFIFTVKIFSEIEVDNYKIYFLLALVFLYLGIFIDFFWHEKFVVSQIFHFTLSQNITVLDERIRGFSLESSTLGATFIILNLLNIEIYKNKYFRIILILTSLICAVFFLEAKGLLLICLFSAFILLIIKYKKLFFILLTIVLFSTLTGDYLQQYFYNKFIEPYELDLYFSTSTVTRLSTILASLNILFTNPFGVGFTGYLPAFLKYLPTSIASVESIFPMILNTTEINGYLTQDGLKNIAVKSFFFENIIIWGLPFLLYWLCFNLKLFIALSRHDKVYLEFILVYCFLALIFYTSIVNMYFFAIAYGVLNNYYGNLNPPHIKPFTSLD